MQNKHPFIVFLSKKAGFDPTETSEAPAELAYLNQTVRLNNRCAAVPASKIDYARSYQRVRDREKSLGRVLARQLEDDSDLLDLSVAGWLNEFRAKKQEFLQERAAKPAGQSPVFRQILEQENHTNELFHELLAGLKPKSIDEAIIRSGRTAFGYKLAAVSAAVLFAALSVVRLEPEISSRIISATDNFFYAPFARVYDLPPAPARIASLPAGQMSRAKLVPDLSSRSAYIRGNSQDLGAQADASGRVYVSEAELSQYLAQSEEARIRVLGEAYEYRESILDKLKKVVIDLLMNKAEE